MSVAVMFLKRGDFIAMLRNNSATNQVEAYDLAHVNNVFLYGDECHLCIEAVLSGRKYDLTYPADTEVEMWYAA